MAYIKKLKENELIGGTDNSDVYPVTHTKAIYDGSNKVLDTRLNENDSDRELLHRQNEKLVPNITTTPVNGTVLEIVDTPNNYSCTVGAKIETFGDEPATEIPIVDYDNAKVTLNGSSLSPSTPPSPTATSVVYGGTLGKMLGNFIFEFNVVYNGISKSVASTIYQNLRKYFGFGTSTPSDVTTLGTSHFSNSVGCTVTIPASGSGYKPIYFCVPSSMTISRVVQPDALNAPLPIENIGTISRVVGGTSFTYNVYKSVDNIDSSVSKRLTIS